MKHPRLAALEQKSQEELVAELRVLAELVHDALDNVSIRAEVGSTAWQQWAYKARVALKRDITAEAKWLGNRYP